jgi:hypothetical protein
VKLLQIDPEPPSDCRRWRHGMFRRVRSVALAARLALTGIDRGNVSGRAVDY